MLHRRFLQVNNSLSVDAFAYSRETCLDASLQSLLIQKILDEETRPGGQLDVMRWRMTSIMNDQFLTATMILCSMVYKNQTQDRLEEVLTSLRVARDIWMRTSASHEATKAVDTINAILAKVSQDASAATGEEEDGISSFEVVNVESEPPLTSSNESGVDSGRLLLQDLDMRSFHCEFTASNIILH